MIDLIDVFILAPHQHGYVVIDGGSKIDHQSHLGDPKLFKGIGLSF